MLHYFLNHRLNVVFVQVITPIPLSIEDGKKDFLIVSYLLFFSKFPLKFDGNKKKLRHIFKMLIK